MTLLNYLYLKIGVLMRDMSFEMSSKIEALFFVSWLLHVLAWYGVSAWDFNINISLHPRIIVRRY